MEDFELSKHNSLCGLFVVRALILVLLLLANG